MNEEAVTYALDQLNTAPTLTVTEVVEVLDTLHNAGLTWSYDNGQYTVTDLGGNTDQTVIIDPRTVN
jgi:hypothetical protein